MDEQFEDDFSPIENKKKSQTEKDSKSLEYDEVSETDSDNYVSDDEISEGDDIVDDDIDSDIENTQAVIPKPRIIPINQTQLEEEHSTKGNKRGITILIIIVALIIIISSVFANVNTGFIGSYKQNFYGNIKYIDNYFGISESFHKIFHEKMYSDNEIKQRDENKAMGTVYTNESKMVPFENATEAKYIAVSGGVIVARSNYIALIDKNGETKWEETTTVVNPILCSEGDYILLAENGGTKLCLFYKQKLKYSIDADNEITNAEVSSNGDSVIVTKKEYFKGAVEVFNKNHDQVFRWNSGNDNIICADISPSGRRVAVGLLNTDNETKASVQLFNINKTESYKTVEIPNSVVFRLSYSGETLNVFCDNRICGMSVNAKILWDNSFDDSQLIAYSINENGRKLALIEVNNVPIMKLYSKGGSEYKSFSVDELPNIVDFKDDYVIFNNTRMVVFGKPGRFKKYAATMDINKLLIIDSNTYLIVYNNSIEFVNA